MKNVLGACFPFLFLYSQFSISPSISLFYVSHSSFSIHSVFHSSISSHLTKFWLDRISGCWVLVVGFGCGVESVAGFGGRFFSVFVGSIWWWVSVLAGSVWWWDLVLAGSSWWLGFVMVFLVVGFRW